ncbi:uncharacterized protein Dwil_GK12140 [Drosophila willistoni]|uniref:Peptidase M13 N-terminal domain-containing protein n=1 Tax=Drosophila willistoni TaxID=7260 RepID=B4N927_DROWI|nr:uncharacterized protein LOC6647268 [Drosophila willistoni]EDW81574.1 uncharacterized protein Dwil_GK12140 [Drosophila willistoni]
MYLVVILVLAATRASQSTSISVENDLLHFSYELEQQLDTSFKPCDDFYGYVCTRNANLNQTVQQQRFQHFLKVANDEQLLDVELQLINFYKSCESNRGIDALKISQLYRQSGGWPALEAGAKSQNRSQELAKNNQTLTWLTLLGHFHEMGSPYFFETVVTMKSNKRLVTIQPDTSRRQTMRKFEQRVSELLQEFGIEQSRAHVAALEVLSFERSRREIIKSEYIDDQVQFNYGNFKRGPLSNVTLGRLDWDGYFRRLLGGKVPQSNDIIVIKQLPRLMDYFLLLQNTTMHRLLNWMWTDYLMDITSSNCQELAETYMGDVYAHVVQRVSADRVELAEMYSAIGKSYRGHFSGTNNGTVWIDELSQQCSQQFLGRVMHLTLDGDEGLDAAYRELILGRRSFYRNLEKLKRFQRKRQPPPQPATEQLRQYAQVFDAVNAVLGKQNLSTPLNYLLVGEYFARNLVAAGSSSRTPGAWRSMDTDKEFTLFKDCSGITSASQVNSNDLLLGLLAHRESWSSYMKWLSQPMGSQLQRRLDSLLNVGRLKLSLKRLYFIGNQLIDCRYRLSAVQQERRRQLSHAILRHTPEFSEIFNCRAGDALYGHATQNCNVF